MSIIRTIHNIQKQQPHDHKANNGTMRDCTQNENLTSKEMNMSQQWIITFRPIVTYAIASRAMNSSLMAKL